MFGFKKSGLSSTAIAAIAISAGLGVGATPAHAQTTDTAPPTTEGLDEIVVTARKRAENIDVVPLAITAMTAARIEERNLKSLDDVAAFTPGFYTQSQTGTGTGRNDRSFRQLTFRGIGANSTNVGVGAGGTAFLDGAPVLNSSLSNVQDLERVEVLRGPQSAYFGRSTFIGAVNYITKDPTDEWTGRLTSEIGQDGLNDSSFSFSGPLADVISIRLSARRFEKDGTFRTSNANVRLGDQSTESYSATLLLQPTDNLKIKTFFNHFEDKDGPPAQYAIAGRAIGPGGSNCNLGGSLGAYYCGEVPQNVDPRFLTANLVVLPAVTTGLIQNTLNFPLPFSFSKFIDGFGLVRKADQYSNRIDYNFDSGLTFTSMSAYHREHIVTVADLAFRGQPANGQITAAVGYKDYDFSQELRLVSDPDERFRWVLGANYIELKQSGSGIPTYFQSFNFTGQFGQARAGQYTQAKTPAVFGGVYFDIVPDLTLTVEGRYQEDEISGHFGTLLPAYPTGYIDVSNTFESFSPRVSLDYKLTPTSTVYALFSRGNKPGGFNSNILVQPQFILNQISSTGAAAAYDEEKLDNYEVGVRGSFYDNRLRLALNGYIGKYKDAQIVQTAFFYTTQNPDGTPNTAGTFNTAALIRNVGEVDLQGVEFEGEAIVAPGLRLGATIAYTGTDIQEYFCSECTNFLSQNANFVLATGANDRRVTIAQGNKLPGAPEWTYTFSANYERDIGNEFTGYAGADFLYRGSYFADAANIAESGSSETVNARLGVRKDNYSIEIFGRNLFDDQSPGISYQPADFTTTAFTTGNSLRLALPDGRRVGVRANVTF